MPKPTLLQSILNRPSQSYQHPADRDYHSTRNELFRIAHATRVIPGQYDDSGLDSSTPGNSDSEAHLTSSATLDRSLRRPSSQSRASSDASAMGPSQSRRSSTHKRTLIHSIPSSSSFVSFRHAETTQPHTRSSSLTTSARQSRSSREPSSKGNDGDAEDSTDDDDGTDIFYTPRSSVVSSPRTSKVSTVMLQPQALVSALLPHRSKSALAPNPRDDDTSSVSRTPSDTSISSVASSTSGGGDDIFSAPSQASSTRPTTTASSDRGSKHPTASVETITIASSTRPRTLSAGAKSAVSSSSSARSGVPSRRKEAIEEASKLTYTDEDWAKDVRWLAPPKMPAASSTKQHSRTLPPDFQISVPPTDPPPSGRRPGHPRDKADRRSKRSRHSRGRMSALWEEDESEECSTGVSSTEPSRSTTPIPETPPHSLPSSPLGKGPALLVQPDVQEESTPSESTHSESTPDARLQKYARGQRRSLPTASPLFRPGESSNAHLPTHALPNPTQPSSTAPASNGYTGLTLPHAGYSNDKGKATAEGRVDLVRAGVAQSSMVTIEVIRGVAATVSNGTAPADIPMKRRKNSFSFSLGRSFSLALKSKKRESATPTHLQGSLPLPVAFTAHVAPPSYVPESHVLVQVHAVGLETLDSLIVHEKSGMGTSGGGGGKGIGGGKAGFIPGRSFVGKVIECGWAVREEVCRRGEWVVGLLDVKKCGALAEFILVERHRVHRAPQPRSRNASLFPPRRRTHIRSQSLPVNGHGQPYSSSPLAPIALSIEELALLPLCGVPAHRAIRSFADVLAPPLGSKPPNSGSRPEVRALILHAHDGAGALAVQMLGRRGVRIAVQVPESAMVEPSESSNTRKLSIDIVRGSPTKDKGKAKEGQKVTVSRRVRLEARLRAWGVEDICVGDPLDVLHQLADDGQSFDMVLDTVGGVPIWEASQRLLTMDWTVVASRSSASLASRNGSIDLSRDPAAPTVPAEAQKPSKRSKNTISQAQFTTLVGDMPHRAIPTAHDNLRSGLRSLKRSMSSSSSSPSKATGQHAVLTKGPNRREKRVVGYAWVSVAADVDYEGEDVRDSLAAVMRMAEAGWLRPPGVAGASEGEGEEGRVVPFERAPEVFRRGVAGPQGVLAEGGTCAVRIVG